MIDSLVWSRKDLQRLHYDLMSADSWAVCYWTLSSDHNEAEGVRQQLSKGPGVELRTIEASPLKPPTWLLRTRWSKTPSVPTGNHWDVSNKQQWNTALPVQDPDACFWSDTMSGEDIWKTCQTTTSRRTATRVPSEMIWDDPELPPFIENTLDITHLGIGSSTWPLHCECVCVHTFPSYVSQTPGSPAESTELQEKMDFQWTSQSTSTPVFRSEDHFIDGCCI